MKQIFFSITILFLSVSEIEAQNPMQQDSVVSGKVTVYKDNRIDELVRKEATFNEVTNAINARSSKGYRLMVLSTNDRPAAMKVRTELLQRFPEQKVYMSFQPPFIKLKFGNFLERSDADYYKRQIIKYKLVTGNIYVVPERIEVKPDKNKDKETN